MAGSFTETTIGDVCQVFDGPHATPTRLDSGPVFLGITSLNMGRIDLSASDHVSEEDFVKWTRRVTPRPGDVVFSYETKLGEAAIIPEGLRCCLGRRMGLMRPDPKKLDSRFLLYYYLGPEFQDVIRERTIHGSTVDRIALIEFPKFPLRIPPLAEQKAIAAVLGSLDDKIELNRRVNATLEAMVRALFQSWFVDFDPVRAKLEARIPTGLDPATFAIFPEQFDRTDDFLRPRGWQVSRLGNHVDLVRGNTYKSKLKDLPGPYLLGLGSIHRNGGFRDDSLRTYGGESAPKLILRPGDLFASLKDVTQAADLLGAVARVPLEIAAGRLTQDTVKLIPHGSDISFAYLYYTLLRPEYREYCRGRATGTTNLGLSREDFLNYPVLVPPPEVQQAFDIFESRLDARIANNRLQTRTLTTLRDALLPKLLSGELRATG